MELSNYAQETNNALIRSGALVDGHFRLKSGLHSGLYVNKMMLASFPGLLRDVCHRMAFEIRAAFGTRQYLVIAPEKGGIAVAQQLATGLIGGNLPVDPAKVIAITLPKKEGGGFEFERHADDLFLETMKRSTSPFVILAEDIVSTGSSIVQVRQSVEAFCVDNGVSDFKFDLCTALVNRGGVTGDDIGIPEFWWPLSMVVPTWDVDNGEECPLCAEGMPINQKLGHPQKDAA